MSRVCAVIVTYNPDSSLRENVPHVIHQVDQVFIVDNGSSGESLAIVREVEAFVKTKVIYSAENLGIAAALNIGVREAQTAGFDWVLTLDQDSCPGEGMVAKMLAAYEAWPRPECVGLICPRVVERRLAAADLPRPELKTREIKLAITSGSLVPTKIFAKVGFFDERLFIYYVDHDLCFRLAAAGYCLLEVGDAVLEHDTGEMSRHSFAGIGFYTTNYNPKKWYYISRNRVVLYRRYGLQQGAWIVDDVFRFFKELAKLAIAEREKKVKLGQIMKGLADALKDF